MPGVLLLRNYCRFLKDFGHIARLLDRPTEKK